ncbi:MAG: hypothetical protein WAK18_10155 [Nocardioidaceae bacterium]
MAVDTKIAEQHRIKSRQARLGLACMASGALGVAVAAFTLAYPAAVPSTQWSYPFPPTVQVVISVVLAAAHLLTLAGFVGVWYARPFGQSRLAPAGLWVAVMGYFGLAIAEILSGAIGDQETTSSAATAVGTVFGIASLLTALGSIVAGTAIARTAVWRGMGRWMVLASGVVMVVLVTPANIANSELLRMIALSLWSLTFLPLGRTIIVERAEPRR